MAGKGIGFWLMFMNIRLKGVKSDLEADPSVWNGECCIRKGDSFIPKYIYYLIKTTLNFIIR